MMILGANIRAVGAHLAGWRHPDAARPITMNPHNSVAYAQLAERGAMHFVFLADGNGVRQMDKPALFAAMAPTDRPTVFEPVTLLSAIAMMTQRIGLVATATTTYEAPFSLARKFASLDHLSGGRAAWNLVTTSHADDALNFGHAEHMPRDERYARAREFVAVVKGLWDSWADDAFLEDAATGRFLDPDRVHVLGHHGDYLDCRGPLNMARPPQGHPVLFSAGQSEPGRDLTAGQSDCMFATGGSMTQAQANYADIKGRMAAFGRDPGQLKILHDVTIYAAPTAAQAEEHFQELQAQIPEALGVDMLSKYLETDLTGLPVDGPLPSTTQKVGGSSLRTTIAETAQAQGLTIRQTYERVVTGSGGCSFKGSFTQVADEMAAWFTGKACDGFVISGPVMPRGLSAVVDGVIPELRRRGLFHTGYAGRTFRDSLGLARPENRFFGPVPAKASDPV